MLGKPLDFPDLNVYIVNSYNSLITIINPVRMP